jgi:phosphatidylglycerophosphate synthase
MGEKALPARAPAKTLDATRPPVWRRLRGASERLFDSYPLPNINPDLISTIGLCIAFLFVVAVSEGMTFVAWIFVLFHLLLDGLDGAIARRYRIRKTHAAKRHGQFVDIVFDRAAEGILFILPPFFIPWFPLFLLNIVLAILTIRWQRALILPLRHAFFVVYTISLLL